jgi:hypothetical protein
MTSSKANKRRFQEGAEVLNRVNLTVIQYKVKVQSKCTKYK